MIKLKYGDRIALLREKRGLTQEELSIKIGISRASLSHYETSRREPDYETINKIANFLMFPLTICLDARTFSKLFLITMFGTL